MNLMNFVNNNVWFRRDRVLFALIALAFLAVLARAFYVQIMDSDFLQSEGHKRQIRVLEVPAARGEIFDRSGHLLALSTSISTVWCDPKVLVPYLRLEGAFRTGDLTLFKGKTERDILRIKHEIAGYKKMTALLNLSNESLSQRILNKPNRRFLYIKRFVLPKVATQVAALGLKGVYVDDAYKRYYPGGETTAHLVGFTDIDGNGLAGVERTYNDWLAGRPGKKMVIKDRAGHVIDFVKNIKVAKPGRSLVLSIDQNLQYFLERALKRVMIEQQPVSASAIILDAQTGEILGLANLPSFNPNDRSQLTGKAIRNRAIIDVVEPGSTIKPLVMAKALELGVVNPDEKINTAPGVMWIQGRRITDTRNHGVLTPTGILVHSSNIGMSKIALKMPAEDLYHLFYDLGFGESVGTFLPGEASGYVKPFESWERVEQASVSFGYGLNVNLLQLVRAYTIFTHDGKLLPVTFLKKSLEVSGEQPSVEQKQVVSSAAAHQVLAMMEKVVSRKGTAPLAQIPGYRVAGKTGTAHISVNGEYDENQYHSFFVGIVPVSHPRFIMAIIVNKPSRGVYYGGLVAAPVFKEVMTEALRLYKVPTDQVLEVPKPMVATKPIKPKKPEVKKGAN